MDRSDRGGLRAVLTDRAFWLGVLAIVAGLVVFGLLFNFAVMPIFTRHDAAVQVPDVSGMTPDEAQSTLMMAGLEGEEQEQPYNPNVAADVVVDQSPLSGTTVKPGRRVYVYVNASPEGLVTIPSDLIGTDTLNARSDVAGVGLIVTEMTEDDRPGPTRGTVSRVSPPAGTQVPAGTRVRLWWSPGPDESREVEVPDVVDLPFSEAKRTLEEAGFYVAAIDDPARIVDEQDPEAGETLNPGREVILE